MAVLDSSDLVGRADDLDRVNSRWLAGHRLLTLTGPAGVGKSRLCRAWLSMGRGGPAAHLWVDCTAAAANPETAVLHPARFAEGDVGNIAEVLAAHDALVFDNAEAWVETIGSWILELSAADCLPRVVITSRCRLGLAGESVVEVAPLSSNQARGLWFSLAQRHGREVDEDAMMATGSPQAELLLELEGIPLALELAAARLEVMSPERLLQQVRTDRLQVLSTQDRGRPDHQRSLPCVFNGSLGDAAATGQGRFLLRLLSVFAAPVELAVVEEAARLWRGAAAGAASVDHGNDHESIDKADILNVLQSLVRASLVRVGPASIRAELTFDLWRDLRAVVRAECPAAVWAGLGRVHAQLLHDRLAAGQADGGLGFSQPGAELEAVLERVIGGNLQQEFLLPSIELLLPLPHRDAFSRLHQLFCRCLTYLRQVPTASADERAGTLAARGMIARLSGDVHASVEDLDQALYIAEVSPRVRARCQAELGVAHHQLRHMDEALAHYRRALETLAAVTDADQDHSAEEVLRGRVVGNIGAAHHDLGEFDDARHHYSVALGILGRQDAGRLRGGFLTNLGVLEHEAEDTDAAHRLYRQALDCLQQNGDLRLVAIARGNLATLLHGEGRLDEAEAEHRQASDELQTLGDQRSCALALGRLGGVVGSAARFDEAERLIQRALDVAEQIGDHGVGAAVRLCRGFLDLALCTQALSQGDASVADRHLQTLTDRLVLAKTSGTLSDDARLLAQILVRNKERLQQGRAPEVALDKSALVIGPQARWFRPPGADSEWQDLRRRGAVRLVLEALLQCKRQQPGAGLDLNELKEAGWPETRMRPDAATNRVHVTLAELRKRGLKPHIQRREGRYFLDEALTVQRISTDFRALGAAEGT